MNRILPTLAANFNLQNLALLAVNIVFIALIFEFLAWFLGRRVEKVTTPLMTADSSRDSAWRVRRRTILRHSPKAVSRALCYAVALILILNAFATSGIQLLAVPLLPLALAMFIVLGLAGVALLPIFRDVVQGYTLLAEDAIAVGDVVQIDEHYGTVERFTLRGVRLHDEEGRLHYLSNRDIARVVVLRRQEGDDAPASTSTKAKAAQVAFDPLHQ